MRYRNLYLFIILLFILYCNMFSLHEGFQGRSKQIILLGDSIFDNEKYVPENKSIESLLKERKDSVMVVAKTGSKVTNLDGQFNKILKSDHFNSKDVYMFISVGGNDILTDRWPQLDSVGYSSDENLKRLFKNYSDNILRLKNRFPEARLFLSTIYFPTDKIYHKYYKNIKRWNTMVRDFGKKYNISLFEVDQLLKSPDDFTNGIEPSVKGSKIIVSAIEKKMMV